MSGPSQIDMGSLRFGSSLRIGLAARCAYARGRSLRLRRWIRARSGSADVHCGYAEV